MNKILLATILSFLSLNLFSQELKKEVYYNESSQDSIKLSIWLPKEYSKGHKYPFFYEFYYDHSNFISASLDQIFDIPKSIVVSIDMTYGNDHYNSPQLTKLGEQNYLFLIKKVLPEIEEKYGCSNLRIAVGLSAGADYCNYILRNNPNSFNYYLIFALESPSYKTSLASYTDKIKTPINYYIATSDDLENRLNFSNKLFEHLKDNTKIEVKKAHYPNASHPYCILYALPNAIDFVFEDYRNIRTKRDNENVLDYLKNLNNEFNQNYGTYPNPNQLNTTIINELEKNSFQTDLVINQLSKNKGSLELYNIAYELIRIGKKKEAEKLLFKAISILPKDVKSQRINPVMLYRKLALGIYASDKKFEKSLEILQKGHRKIKHYEMGILYYIGMISIENKVELKVGIKAIEKALSLEQQSDFSKYFTKETLYDWLITAYKELGNDEKVKFYTEQQVESQSN